MNILVGMLTGATASMGLGGGFILLVYLSVFTEIPQDIAQGINLLFFLPIALLSLVIHIKNKLTDLKLVGKYLILGLPCAIAGSYVAGITDVAVLRKLFGIFVLYIGINQLYVSFTNKPCKKRSDSKLTPSDSFTSSLLSYPNTPLTAVRICYHRTYNKPCPL